MKFASWFCTLGWILLTGSAWADTSFPQGRWGSVDVSIHSEAEVREFFAELRAKKELAWDYPADQCYARAYLSSWLLSQRGVKPVTLWNLAPQDAPLLRVETQKDPRGCLVWRYHVATGVVMAHANGDLEGMVLDPAMADEPLRLWDWVGLMKRHYPDHLSTEVWSSHPYAYRREDLGASESNELLAEGSFRPQILDRYWRLVLKNRNTVDSPRYQEGLRLLREKIAQGQNPAHQIPDPCPAQRRLPFEFNGERLNEDSLESFAL